MNSLQTINFTTKPPPTPPPKHASARKSSPFCRIPSPHIPNPKFHLKNAIFSTPFALVSLLSSPLPSPAAEIDGASGKINIESIVLGVDDFFNRNPFFIAGVTFIWLVAIPLAQEYLKKCKAIMAIDAFRKLRDLPNSQLLDIRRKQSFLYMDSPDLSAFGKKAVWLEFDEDNEDGYVKDVLKSFRDPRSTVLCVLDNFDGNSLKVAELLFKNGFKEAYAIEGGLRGNEGWQAIQETLLPPSFHVHPRKKKSKKSTESELDIPGKEEKAGNNGLLTSSITHPGKNITADNGHLNRVETATEAKAVRGRPLSPYPNYLDLKPPSSPTPSKPCS